MSRDVTGYCAFHAFAGTEAERETCEDCHAMQKMGERMFQPPATPQEPDVRGDIGHQNAEIQRLGNAVRDGSATSEMAYAWLTHPYVCTSDMVKAAARIMAMSKLFADIRFGLTHMLVLGVLRPEEASKIKARLTRLERKWRKNKGKQP